MAKKSANKTQFNKAAPDDMRDGRRAIFTVVQGKAKRYLEGEAVSKTFVPEAVSQNFVCLRALGRDLNVQPEHVKRIVLNGNLNTKQFKIVARSIASATYTP